MEKAKSGYATNKGGLIKAPVSPAKDDPRATATVAKGGRDLRNRKYYFTKRRKEWNTMKFSPRRSPRRAR